jgi:glutaconate CoA-transferase subunit A
MEILAEGKGEYFPPDPDGFRAWVRDHKPRTLVNKLMNEQEAIQRFVSDGDYFAYDCNYFQRGPSSLIREVIRQGKKDLWVCGKFTYVAVALLVEAGCASKVDIGFVGFGPWLSKAVAAGRVKTYEYSNVVMTYRLQAGAQGLPFIGVRSFGGTDGFPCSGAKLVTDPFSGKPVVLLPALNPDVALIHVHQADIYGNARVFRMSNVPLLRRKSSFRRRKSLKRMSSGATLDALQSPTLWSMLWYTLHLGPTQGLSRVGILLTLLMWSNVLVV